MNPPAATVRPSFRTALGFWLRLGCISFGGPAGQIAIMHRELVERRGWIGEGAFLHALNFCMLLPGPEAQQLATYIGWRLHGVRGGVVAGGLFVLPSALLLWGLAWAYMALGSAGWFGAIFAGLKPAVLAIVAAAVLRIGTKALKTGAMWSIAVLAFVAIYFGGAPFPLIVGAAALAGWLGGRKWRGQFLVVKGHGESHAEAVAGGAVSPGRTVRVVATCLALWVVPVLVVGAWLGWGGVHFEMGTFFSKAALVTFGGAYAVLPYVAQQAVEKYAWLSAPQMLDGLGLAETTPGPLIMVLQFAGFVGAWQHAGAMSPLGAASLGAAITTWTTFLPSFLFVLAGAPYVERLRAREGLSCALSAITAAVVGVIANLAVWFAAQVLVLPTGVDWFAVAVCVASFAAMHFAKWDVMRVVAVAAALGLGRWLVG